ncbi:hypothetical protein SAY87_014107 [Trapa incisa]|uniref:Bifunctional inhibitor/plant lipid transfer protein/seed storage helical domain-containing protein n=1 Tax=Trapa incisa TaxID=236973 RepID=A0AAN7GJF3_9MYRT|nr:hypothetical protein SAY87_014107 [Trapa incisa]
MKRPSALLLVVAALLLVLVVAQPASAVVCKSTELQPCVPAIVGPPTPSPECCKKLKEQTPCFCTYLKDPRLRKYLGNPKAKQIAKVCGVAFPPIC